MILVCQIERFRFLITIGGIALVVVVVMLSIGMRLIVKIYSSPFYEHTYTDVDVMYVEAQRKYYGFMYQLTHPLLEKGMLLGKMIVSFVKITVTRILCVFQAYLSMETTLCLASVNIVLIYTHL